MNKSRNLSVQTLMDDMTEGDMKQRLRELATTNYWPAILRYFDSRVDFVEGALRTLDAFKEPTQMARNQGTLMGLGDLEEAVNLIIEEEKEQKRSIK